MQRTLLIGLFLLIGIGVSLGGAFSTTAHGQGGVYMAQPPVLEIEVSGFEPLPPDAAAQLVVFGGRGGGGEDFPSERELRRYYAPVPAPYWADTPAIGPGTLRACGFRGGVPRATLTWPSGRQAQVRGQQSTGDDGSRCFSWSPIQWEVGMEFGLYTLSVESPGGLLTHVWAVDYPPCSQMLNMGDQQYWLMGFTPGEPITVRLYREEINASTGEATYAYVASRPARIGDDGSLYLRIRAARSAPFRASDLYFIITGSGNVIRAQTVFSDDPKSIYKLPPFPVPAFDTFLATSADIEYPIANSDSFQCGARYERFVQVFPRRGNTVQLFAAPDSQSRLVTQVEVGLPLEIVEKRPVLTSTGRAAIWFRVRSEDGREGWATGPNFARVFTLSLRGGMMAEVRPVGFDQRTGRDTTANVYFREQPSLDAPIAREISVGEQVRLIAPLASWWYVQLRDGTRGWMPDRVPGSGKIDWVVFDSLPWRPIDVANIPVPRVNVRICPGSPVPRLSVGIRARVTPGDPNNLRYYPDGEVMGKIPGGGVFTVIGGPACSGKGLTFWLVDYEGQQGWTAEGQRNEYWLEPLN